MTVAVEMSNVSFSYPDAGAPALRDVSLEIESGSLLLVAGPTGSGKSTLLRAVNGLVPHFSGGSFAGRVCTEGRDTLEHPPRYLADVVAFVPQEVQASFVLDRVEDEVAYAMENLAIEPRVMRRRVEEVLDIVGIEPLRRRRVDSLSGGERQRVAIAAALAPGAQILLLDEPTSQLDPQGAEDVLNVLQRLVHDLGYTVVLAEHRLDRVATYADTALGCLDGSVTPGTVPDILDLLQAGPPVTRLGRLLGWKPPPLTVRDARAAASTLHLPEPDSARAGCSVSSSDRGDDAVLVCTDLGADYDGVVALRDVSLSFSKGEVVSLVGRNGAGKSTLLRCLAGLHPPSVGQVRFLGRPPRTGRDVALCPQSPETLLFSPTVREEVAVTMRSSGSSRAVDDYLDELGLRELSQRHPRDVSAGQRLLVAVAAVAATEAPVILLDEPTRGLDPESKSMLAAILGTWSRHGRVVILATHDVELAAELAHRVVMLAGGEVIADGAPGDVLADSSVFSPQMTRVFGRGWLTPEQVAAAVG